MDGFVEMRLERFEHDLRGDLPAEDGVFRQPRAEVAVARADGGFIEE